MLNHFAAIFIPKKTKQQKKINPLIIFTLFFYSKKTSSKNFIQT